MLRNGGNFSTAVGAQKEVNMQKASNRMTRAASEIRKILSEFLLVRKIVDTETNVDPAMISITDVVLSSDFQHAKVFIVSISQDISNEKCIKFLEKHKSKLRKYLGDSVRMRYIPDLRFFEDNSFETADRIEKIISGLKIPAAVQE